MVKKINFKKTHVLSFMVIIFVFIFFNSVLFASTGSGGLPWEDPLKAFMNSIRGPVAMVFSLIAIVICGFTFAWGGEMSDLMKTFLKIIIVIAMIIGAGNILSILFGVSGAVINKPTSSLYVIEQPINLHKVYYFKQQFRS